MPVELHQPTKLPKRTKDPKTISTRAASVGQGKNEAPLVPKPSSGVEIQCMRMRKLLAAKALDTPPVVISTVEVLESYLTNKTQSKIIIRIRFFLWISYHCYEPWKLVRLHVVDADSPESLEELLQVFQVSYKENSSEIDFMLLTASMWNMQSDSELLPVPGCVVDINDYSNVQLFRETHCQLTTRVRNLSLQGMEG
ncbi:hypothetical protein PC128_g17397 [Phytophthora cactorum]|nr:hypothetical protein PC120_g13002 [Phytophthora cactorum]KAG3059950.1 hypothetical protein PC121_g13732 [Phytophthora cactorum]KAG3176170.1 hypothetical protein PC128_g17397 [Phytophthora cactorum]KAG4052503.1 hypothetical protein PC123_g12316 [Phytophthora cactorum]